MSAQITLVDKSRTEYTTVVDLPVSHKCFEQLHHVMLRHADIRGRGEISICASGSQALICAKEMW